VEQRIISQPHHHFFAKRVKFFAFLLLIDFLNIFWGRFSFIALLLLRVIAWRGTRTGVQRASIWLRHLCPPLLLQRGGNPEVHVRLNGGQPPQDPHLLSHLLLSIGREALDNNSFRLCHPP